MRTAPSTKSLLVVLILLAIGLTGCGGGGSSGGKKKTGVRVPPAPVLHLEIRSGAALHFSWDDVDGETVYRLMEDIDGASGYDLAAQIDANETSHSLTVTVADHVNARFALEACNAAGCSRSSEIIVADVLVEGIVYLKAPNTDPSDLFGLCVALSGDGRTLAVGAPGEDGGARGPLHPGDAEYDSSLADNSSEGSGAVYVFTWDGDRWQEEAYIKSPNADPGDRFGGALDLSDDGDTLVVGAGGEDGGSAGLSVVASADNSLEDSGAAYIFTRGGSRWYTDYYIKPSNPRAGNAFSSPIALSGDGGTLAIGNQWEDSRHDPEDDLYTDSGAVYVYLRDASTWYQQALLKAPYIFPYGRFGRAVTLSTNGDWLAVGAPYDESGVPSDTRDDSAVRSGAVHMYTRSDGTWTRHAYVKASNLDAGDGFGASVALSGDGNLLVVGADYECGSEGRPDDDSLSFSGAVYTFARTGWIWDELAYLKAEGADEYDNLGMRVRVSADGVTVAATSPGESSAAVGVGGDASDNSADGAGAVYLFSAHAGIHRRHAYVKASNTEEGDDFGRGLAISADGLTLAVGASIEAGGSTGVGGDHHDNSASHSGAVYIYRVP